MMAAAAPFPHAKEDTSTKEQGSKRSARKRAEVKAGASSAMVDEEHAEKKEVSEESYDMQQTTRPKPFCSCYTSWEMFIRGSLCYPTVLEEVCAIQLIGWGKLEDMQISKFLNTQGEAHSLKVEKVLFYQNLIVFSDNGS